MSSKEAVHGSVSPFLSAVAQYRYSAVSRRRNCAVKAVAPGQYHKEISAKLQEEAKNLEQKYADNVESIFIEFYNRLIREWQMPDKPLVVELLRFKSEEEIKHFQVQLPDEWFRWADECYCWRKGNYFYLLKTKDSAETLAKQNPDQWDTVDKIKEHVIHITIPVKDIYGFSANGAFHHSVRTVGSGNITYTGVSVNGIGFGEIKQDPTFVLPDVKDTRYITLFYYAGESHTELQTLYLGGESIETLTRILPEYKR